MKSLEALRRIDIHLPRNDETQEKQFSEYISIIKKNLMAMEIVKQKLSVIGRCTFLPMSLEDLNLLTEVLDDECRTDD